jgi:hypothetical protein
MIGARILVEADSTPDAGRSRRQFLTIGEQHAKIVPGIGMARCDLGDAAIEREGRFGLAAFLVLAGLLKELLNLFQNAGGHGADDTAGPGRAPILASKRR